MNKYLSSTLHRKFPLGSHFIDIRSRCWWCLVVCLFGFHLTGVRARGGCGNIIANVYWGTEVRVEVIQLCPADAAAWSSSWWFECLANSTGPTIFNILSFHFVNLRLNTRNSRSCHDNLENGTQKLKQRIYIYGSSLSASYL